ncbi:MAG: phosphoenolpyruvate synthase, partial [Desulfuromonadales bacterium]|nr:phosphoenolpyruvate synthase [Desulfuromonadales bacterium]
MREESKWVRWFEDLTAGDVASVGGKNASLGEMIQTLESEGVRVPGGFATTAEAYRRYLEANDLTARIGQELTAFQKGEQELARAGKKIRRLFLQGEFPPEVGRAVVDAYGELCRRQQVEEVAVAVRSSATAEDLPEASFAGQQETFLNIAGEDELLDACRRCYASLFTDRAIVYRENNGFDHLQVALSVGVQKMVRSDLASAGVMFSIDTETGFPRAVVISAAWGLGENVVQGTVTPDEYLVFKPLLENRQLRPIIGKSRGNKEQKMIYGRGGSQATRNVRTSRQERHAFALTDEEILQLARWGSAIEAHYGQAMDMEWAKDGETQELYIV